MGEGKKGIKCKCAFGLGLIVLLLGLLADQIGIGGGPGVGTKQLVVIVIGAVLLVVGLTTNKYCKCCKKCGCEEKKEEPPAAE